MAWEYVFILNTIEICRHEKAVSEHKDVGKISNLRFSARFMSDGSLNMMCKKSWCTIRNETLSLLAMYGVKRGPAGCLHSQGWKKDESRRRYKPLQKKNRKPSLMKTKSVRKGWLKSVTIIIKSPSPFTSAWISGICIVSYKAPLTVARY